MRVLPSLTLFPNLDLQNEPEEEKMTTSEGISDIRVKVANF